MYAHHVEKNLHKRVRQYSIRKTQRRYCFSYKIVHQSVNISKLTRYTMIYFKPGMLKKDAPHSGKNVTKYLWDRSLFVIMSHTGIINFIPFFYLRLFKMQFLASFSFPFTKYKILVSSFLCIYFPL